jgi:PAS domain S-box-containing protein
MNENKKNFDNSMPIKNGSKVTKCVLGNWEWDINSNYVTISESLLSIDGLERLESPVLISKLQNFLSKPLSKSLQKQFSEAIQSGKSFSTKFQFITNSNSVFDSELYCYVFKDNNDKTIALYGTLRVILTDGECLEHNKLNNYLEGLFELSTEMIIVHDVQTGKIVSANSLALDTYGYSLEEFKTLDIQKISSGFESYTQDIALEKIELSKEKGVQYFEWLNKNRMGNLFWTEVKLKYFTIDSQEYVLVSERDISYRKSMEEELRRGEEKFRNIFTDATIGMVLTDFAGKIIDVNNEYCRILGRDKNEVIGKSCEIFTLKDDFLREGTLIQSLIQGEIDNYRIEKRLVNKQGGIIWVDVIRKVQTDDNDKPVSMIGLITDITLRKETEKALNESKQKLFETNQLQKMLLDNIPVRLFWKDLNSIYLGCNNIFASDAGLPSPEQIIGKSDYELSWIEEASRYRKDDLEVMISGQEKIGFEEPQTGRDGQKSWLRTSKVPLRDMEGKVIGVIGTYEDITKAKLYERTLKENTQKFKNLSQSVSVMMNYESMTELYDYVASEIHLQYPESYVVFTEIERERNITISVLKGFRDKLIEKIEQLTGFNIYQKKFSVSSENLNLFKQGNLVEFTGGLEEFSRNQMVGFVLTSIEKLLKINKIYTIGVKKGDTLYAAIHIFTKNEAFIGDKEYIETFIAQCAVIIERKLLLNSLRESEEKYHNIIDSATDAILITDMSSGIVHIANGQAEMLLKKPVSDIVGSPITNFFPESKKEEYSVLLKGNTENESISDELTLINSESLEVPVTVSKSQLVFGGKKYLSTIFHDITQRKNNEQRIEQQNGQLKQLIKTKDKLFSVIGHDLKNPLNAIIGFSEILSEDIQDSLNDNQKEFLNIITNSAQSMSVLISNLVHWSRAQQGRLRPMFVRLNINQLIVNEFSLHRAGASNKKLRMLNTVSDKIEAFADREMVSTILRNFISNAIKFTPKNGEVSVHCEVKNNKVIISVVDSGIGIDPDMVKSLFDFESSASTLGTEGEKGTGLGLAICKEFAELNGGKIGVESKLGEGSRFYFTLPEAL